MNRREIRQRYNDSFDALTPDIFNRIIETGNDDSMKEGPADNICSFGMRRHGYRRIAALSGAAAACVIAAVGINMYGNQVVSEVVIDTNASIQIDVKRNGNVDRIAALDTEAEGVVESVDSGSLEDTVDAIIDKCVKDGYLKDSDAVLVSMESGGASGLLEETSDAINAYRDDNKDDFSVICQVYDGNEQIVKLAEDNAISPGHAALCTTVAEKAEEKGIADVKMDALCTESIGDILKEAMKYDIGIEEVDSIIWDGDEVKKYKEKVLVSPSAKIINESVDSISVYEYNTNGKYYANVKNDAYDASAQSEYVKNINLGICKNQITSYLPVNIDYPLSNNYQNSYFAGSNEQPSSTVLNRNLQQQNAVNSTYNEQLQNSAGNNPVNSGNKQTNTKTVTQSATQQAVQNAAYNNYRRDNNERNDNQKVWYNGDYWWGVGGFWGVNWNEQSYSQDYGTHNNQCDYLENDVRKDCQATSAPATPKPVTRQNDQATPKPSGVNANDNKNDTDTDTKTGVDAVADDIQTAVDILDEAIEDENLEKAHALEPDCGEEDDVMPVTQDADAEPSASPEPPGGGETGNSQDIPTSDTVDTGFEQELNDETGKGDEPQAADEPQVSPDPQELLGTEAVDEPEQPEPIDEAEDEMMSSAIIDEDICDIQPDTNVPGCM